MAPFIVLAPTDEAFAAALEALGVTAEELLARDDLADILLIQPAGRYWEGASLKIRLFRDRWQLVRLTALLSMASFFSEPTCCLTLWLLADRLLILWLSW